MTSSTRNVRQSTRYPNTKPTPVPEAFPCEFRSPQHAIKVLAAGSDRLPGLTIANTQLLREKQISLQLNATAVLEALPTEQQDRLKIALEATLIFAQYDAGTAVCIDPAGWILTCAHCFAETEKEWYTKSSRRKWLLFHTGLAVQVECQSWNSKCDLALAKIITIESEPALKHRLTFPSVSLAASARAYLPIVCIGQPGRDDLESTSFKRTKYNLIEVSEGRLRGMMAGDPHDNSEIGSLKHDAWTYWGHSGAPLISKLDGGLVGLHSSWDDRTAMRHGIPLVAIKTFLEHEQANGLTSAASQQQGDQLNAPKYSEPGEVNENMKPLWKYQGSSATSPIIIDDI